MIWQKYELAQELCMEDLNNAVNIPAGDVPYMAVYLESLKPIEEGLEELRVGDAVLEKTKVRDEGFTVLSHGRKPVVEYVRTR
jgi:hypothetical protein